MKVSLVDYGDSIDLKFMFGRYRQFSFRHYRDWSWRYWAIRRLSFKDWKRFAVDCGPISFVFENYSR